MRRWIEVWGETNSQFQLAEREREKKREGEWVSERENWMRKSRLTKEVCHNIWLQKNVYKRVARFGKFLNKKQGRKKKTERDRKKEKERRLSEKEIGRRERFCECVDWVVNEYFLSQTQISRSF